MRFELKLSLIIAAFTATLLVVGGAFIANQTSANAVEALGSKLTGIAITTALTIDPKDHEQVSATRDSKTSAYRRIRQTLLKIQRANKPLGVTYVYTMQRTKTPYVWEFIVDADESEDFCVLGTTYSVRDKLQMQDAFSGPISDAKIVKDRWGETLSGYAPIINTHGETVGIVGVDATAKTVRQAQARSRKSFLSILLIGLLLCIPASFAAPHFLLGPLKKLITATERVGKGDLDHEVDIATGDEFERLGRSFNSMVQGLREREFVKETLSKYVSEDVAKTILSSQTHTILAGERRRVTVLFTDVRKFTAMAENMRPEDVLTILNEHFSMMIDVLFKFEGTLDKFLGDGLMATFGAPITHPNDAERAVRAALQMQVMLGEFNQKRRSVGAPELEVGIGINSGTAIAGNIGSIKRKEYSVIGDTVNVAARIQGVALGGQIVISPSTHDEIKDIVEVEELQPITLKGKSASMKLYRVLSIS